MARHKVEINGVNTANIKVLDNEEMIKLFSRYQQGDVKAKELLINGNLKLVLSILKKYNNFIFTMETALYLYGFKGIKLNNYSIATKRKAKVIKNELIKQYFIPDDLYEIGLTRINYIGYEVKLYDKERLLLEIIKK